MGILLQMVKPLLEPKTYNKVKFVYSDDPNSKKIMEDLFDMDHLESAFGGNDNTGFDINKYAERMKEDDKKIPSFWTRANTPSAIPPDVPLDSIKIDTDSDTSDNEKTDYSPAYEMDTEIIKPDQTILVDQGGGNAAANVQH